MTGKTKAPLAASLVVAVCLLSVTTVREAEAQLAFGLQGNWGSEADFGVGARLLANVPNVNVEVVGSFDYFFPESDVDWLDFNANAFYHFHLPDSPSVMPYAGAGLNIARVSNGDSTTELGLNLGGGVRFPRTGVTPFVEARGVVASDADQFVITAGLLFGNTRFR